MKSQITKGPWYRFDGSILPVSGGPLIAQVEKVDDARLIASAPDMLSVLHGIVSQLETGVDPLQVAQQARGIIAKAEGK